MERPAPLALKAKTESLIAERLPDADLSPVIQKLEEQIRASGQTKAELFDQVVRLAARGKDDCCGQNRRILKPQRTLLVFGVRASRT